MHRAPPSVGIVLLLVAAAMTGFLAPASIPADTQAATPIGACTTITHAGRYVLTADIENSTATTCIDIHASDVVLDGAGHTIDGVNANQTTGIASANQTNVTVRNVTLTDWYTGIGVDGGRDVTVSGVTTRGQQLSVYAERGPYGVSLRGVTHAVVRDSDFASPDWYGSGVFAADSADVTVRNVTTSRYEYGIQLQRTDDSTVRHVTAGSSTGIDVSGDRNVIEAANATPSADYGIVLGGRDSVLRGATVRSVEGLVASGDNLTVSNVSASGTLNAIIFGGTNSTLVDTRATHGIDATVVIHGDNHTVRNLTVTNENFDSLLVAANDTVLRDVTATGVELRKHGNVLVNSTIRGDGVILNGATDTTLTRNTIANNSVGILVERDAIGNLVYDNVLNNTQNVRFETTAANAWNVSARAGPNVIGGPSIGGNYYATPSGTGFSETCTDANGDGFCDAANTFDGTPNNTDFLPLAAPGTPSNTTPEIALSTNAVGFGHVVVGHTATRHVTIRNDGNATLTVTRLSLTGRNTDVYALSNASTPLTLAPGATHTLTVQFSPDSPGAKTASLAVTSDDPALPNVHVRLYGIGTPTHAHSHPDRSDDDTPGQCTY